jgi:PAS domain-containing protein
MGPRGRRVWLQIVTPLLAVGLATFATMHVPVLRNRSSLFIFLAAVVISMRLGGWFGGFFATILSVAATAYFLMEPLHTLAVSDRGDMLRLGLFTVISLMILVLYGSRSKAEMALRASEQRLALALDSAHMGVWDYNLLTRKFWWSTTLEIIYARTDGTFPSTYGRFFGFIHFDDQPLFNRAITRTIDEGTDYEVDHRIILPDESIRWVNTRGRVFFNEASRAERIVGVATDITAKKKHERQQQMSRDATDEAKLSVV